MHLRQWDGARRVPCGVEGDDSLPLPLAACVRGRGFPCHHWAQPWLRVLGDDEQVLNDTANRVARVLQRIDGATDVKVEQTTSLPMVSVNVDRG